MSKFSICLVAIVIAAALEVCLAGSIGHHKSKDPFRGNHIGLATDKCSALKGLLPDPKSGCCGRHAKQDEDEDDNEKNIIDDENIGDRTNDNNEITNYSEHSQSGITNDDEREGANSDGAKCIDIKGIINNVVNNVIDSIKDRVTTWISGGEKNDKKSLPSGLISLEHQQIIPNEIIANDSKFQSTGLRSGSVVGFIAAGTPTGLRQYPWLVHYTIKTGSLTFNTKVSCGGSLISPRFVLTAAHCLHKKYRSYDNIDIALAEYNTNTSRDCVGNTCIKNVLMHPDNVIIHKDYEFTKIRMVNDIALMRLKGSAPYTDYIRPICLPPFNIDVPKNEGMPLTIAGWGDTGRGASPVKLAAQIHLVTQRTCTKYYSQLTPGQMCAAGRTGQDVCPGDSGGPIMMEKEGTFYLVGVISGKMSSICGSSKPSFYTNVFAYQKWIEENMIV